MSEKHYLIAKIIDDKGTEVFSETFEVNLGEMNTKEITKMLNDNLADLVKLVPKSHGVEMKIIGDADANV